MKSKLKDITRIKKVLRFYELRGINSERCNKIYYKILNCKNKQLLLENSFGLNNTETLNELAF